MKKSFLWMTAVLGGFGLWAADGTWTKDSVGQWSDPANWLNGVLPDDGGFATIHLTNKGGATLDASGVTATLGGFLLSATVSNLNSGACTISGGQFTLVPPAMIGLTNVSAFVFGPNTLANAGDTLVWGYGRCVFQAPQALTGRTVISNAYLRIAGDTALGPTPATLKTDAVILDGGTLQNGMPNVTVAATRGITLTERGGYLMAGFNMPASLTVASPITGPGSLGINYENGPVYLCNPANDWTGDTVVGAHGPGWDTADEAFALHLKADEVIPHGDGKGRLRVAPGMTLYNEWPYQGMQQNGPARLHLDGHTETVNALDVGVRAEVFSTNATGRLVLASDADSDFRGTLHAGVTVEKHGTGTLSFFGGSIEGVVELKEGTLELGGENTVTGCVTLAGGQLRLVPPSGCAAWFASTAASAERYDGWRKYPYHGRRASGLPAGARVRYRCRWHVADTGTYSFLKSYAGRAALWLDGNLIVSNDVSNATAAMVRDVLVSAGWHDVELLFERLSTSEDLPSNAYINGIMYDPGNGAFTTKAEGARARMFADDGGPDVRASGVPSAYTGTLRVLQDSAVEVVQEAEPLVFAGVLETDEEAASPVVLTVATATGTPVFFGGVDARHAAVLGRNTSVLSAGGIVYTNFVVFKEAPAPDAVIAAGATVTYDYAGALVSDITLTDTDLRVSSAGTGDGTITVPVGRTVIFDTQSVVDGMVVDPADGTRTYANAVILQGGTLELSGAGSIAFTGTVSGYGRVVKNGSGDAVFSSGAGLTAESAVEIRAGALRVPAAGSLGAATIRLMGGRLANVEGQELSLANPFFANGGGVEVTGADDVVTLPGRITAGMPISKWGAGLLRFTGAEPNGEYIHVRGGTLALAKDETVAAAGAIIGCEPGCTLRLEGEGQIPAAASVTLSGGTLDMNGHDLTVATFRALTATSMVTNCGGAPSTLTQTGDAVEVPFTGTLTDGTAPLIFANTGKGTWDFTQATIANSGMTVGNGVAVFAGRAEARSRLFRFTVNKARPAPSDPPTYGGTGVQCSEFQLLLDGEPFVWPSGTTATAAGPASGKEMAQNLVDGSMSTKWYYANGVGKPITITCPEDVTFNAYRFATANDAIGRDPVSWTFESGEMSGGVTNWVVIDTQTDVSNLVTMARNSWQQAFPVHVQKYLAALPTDYALTVSGAGVARFVQTDQTFSSLAGDGRIEAVDDASFTLVDGSSFTGRVASPARPVSLAFTTAEIPGVAAANDATVIENDGVAGALTFASGTALLHGVVRDGTAPLGLDVAAGATVMLNDAGNAYTGATTVRAGGTLFAAGGHRARYLRFSVLNTTGNAGKRNAQLSEIRLMRDGAEFAWPEGTIAETTWANSAKGEGAAQLIDGMTSTKCFWSSSVYPVVITLPGPVYFEGYSWYTANDSMSVRNPVSWTLEISDDGETWTTIDAQTNRVTTTATCSLAYSCTMSVADDVATASGLAGSGTVQVGTDMSLRLAVAADAAFTGTVAGPGVLVKAGAARQTLGGAVTVGTLVVEAGVLDLADAALTGVTNIVLKGGTLVGTATVAGDLTVTSLGGAYGAHLAVSGALTLAGAPTLATGFSGQAVRGTAFTFGSLDDVSRAIWQQVQMYETIPRGWRGNACVTGSALTYSVVPGGTTIFLR